MATTDFRHAPKVARVDQLVDENGAPIAVPEDSALEVTDKIEETIGATGPTAWWRYGLLALAILVAIVLFGQLMMGGSVSDLPPGTPATAPQQTTSK